MFRKSLLAFALCCSAGVAHAGDKPLYEPAPGWLKPVPAIDAAKLSDADPVMLMLDQQQRLENGQVWQYTDTATRIASPQLLTQIGTLQFPWDPAKGDLIVHRLEILRGGEKIDLLAGGARFNVIQREQMLERAWLNGMLTATLAVEGLRVGDVLRVSISMTRKDAALDGHMQTMAMLIPAPNRLQYGRVRLVWPKSVPLQWHSFAKVDAQPVDGADGYRELTISIPTAKPAEVPGDAPLRYQPLPLLEAADYGSWSALSKQMAPLFRTEGAIVPGGPLAAEVEKIAAATSDPRKRAAMALQLVQDKVRYLFKGMDNGDYRPQPVALTWSARYGDCKAKSLLLLAMLRALGVEADAALVNSSMGDLLGTRLAAPLAFDHVIVRAKIGGETFWLDGTAGGSRDADLADVPPFRRALPLREEGAELVDMPMRRPSRPETQVALDIDASAGVLFPMPFKIRVETRGGTAEMLRLMSMQAGKEQADPMIDSMLLTPYLGVHQTMKQALAYDEATGTTTITAEGVVQSNWTRDGGRYKVQLDTSVDGLAFAPDRARTAWRDIPVTTGAPDDKRVRVRIRLPDGGKDFALEGDQKLPASLAGVLLDRAAELKDGWITVDDRVTSGIGEIAPADIPATRAQLAQAKGRLLKAIAPLDYRSLSSQVAAARRAKTLDPILAVYAARIAEKPDEAAGYTARAIFLSSIFDWQGTLRDLDKVIALAADADTHLWRARIRRTLGDDKGAMADARAALDLDPGSAGAINLIATLQAAGGKRGDALATVADHMATAGKDEGDFVSLRAELTADGGQVEEAIGLMDTAIAAKPGNASLLNSRCWLKGTRNVALDTALKDCTKSIELSENPAPALDSRAMVYFRMNRFDDALADLQAALEAFPDLSASLFMRGIIRKRTGAAGADDDLAAARLIDPRVDKEYAAWGIAP